MDGEELAIFREAVRQVAQRTSAEDLDKGLESLGWRDALRADRRAAISTLFELQGSANATSSALDFVLAEALGLDDDAISCVVLPALGSVEPPGRVAGEKVSVRGLATRAMARGERVCVVTKSAETYGCVTVDAGRLTARRLSGIDPELALVEVTGDVGAAPTASLTAPDAWSMAVALGRLALSQELLGASRAMLALACDHARERVQFGRPIAAFQAVRHRLAESLVAIEGSHAALAAAWDEGSELAASVAKAVSGRGARTVARHSQQVLAGMGFTMEHPFHRHLRRVLVLDQILGSSRSIMKATGEMLLRERSLPLVIPL